MFRALIFVPRRAMSGGKVPPKKTPGSGATTTTTTSATTTPAEQDHTKSAVMQADHHHDDDSQDLGSTSGQTAVNMNKDGVGFKSEKYTRDTFFNPLLTPPPRSPRTPEDFRNADKLGHWTPIGFSYEDPVRDKYMFHEAMFLCFTGSVAILFLFIFSPDYYERDWARREAFLRLHKRDALGLPPIDPNVIEPDRIVLPTEEELGDYDVTQ